jgi:zinc protease
LRSASEIEHELDRLGAVLGASNDRDSLQLSARFLKETFAEGLDLYMEILLDPAFPEVEVAREKADQLREIEALKENRFQFTMQHFLRTFYGRHPYNHLSIGTRDGLASVTRDDLLAFHQTLLRPEQAVYVVVGDITAEEVLTLWHRVGPVVTSDTPQPRPEPALPEWSEAVSQVIEMDGQQTHIVWGFPTVSGRDHDRYALHVLDTILGGMGGRLFTELRDQKSLAYTVTSFDAYPRDPGFLALYIGCSPEKETEALSEFERVVQELHSSGVTPEELERAQTYLEGALDIGLQSTSQRTAVYGMGMLQQGKWNAYQEYLDAVRKVSQADVQRVARTYLQPSRAVRTILRGKR